MDYVLCHKLCELCLTLQIMPCDYFRRLLCGVLVNNTICFILLFNKNSIIMLIINKQKEKKYLKLIYCNLHLINYFLLLLS